MGTRHETAARTARQDRPAHGRYLPIDRIHLARQTLGDRNLELEVLRLFDDMLATCFGRIERSTTRAELVLHVHDLRAAAAGVGARAVADLAEVAEAELRRGDPVNPERIDDIGVAVHECRAYVASIISSDRAARTA